MFGLHQKIKDVSTYIVVSRKPQSTRPHLREIFYVIHIFSRGWWWRHSYLRPVVDGGGGILEKRERQEGGEVG